MMSERGQASTEMMLIVGAILLIVISVYPSIKTESEMNRGITAARDGATYAVNMLGMGFSESGSGITPPNKTVQLVGLSYSEGAVVGGLTPITITLEIRGTSDTTVGDAISDQSLKFIYKVFKGNYNIGSDPQYVDSESYRFYVTSTFT